MGSLFGIGRTRILTIPPKARNVELVPKQTIKIETLTITGNKEIKIKSKKNRENKENLRNILLHSNANPFRCKDHDGYGCSFCIKKFPQARSLKSHYLDEHHDETFIQFMSGKLFEKVVKLDITFLHCTICNKNTDKLDDLMTHLKNEHQIEMFTNVKNQIIPFKFETEELRCAICSTTFGSFKLLQEHMNAHFGHFMCQVCGTGFVSDRLLKSHLRRHDNGEYKCDDCEKTFNNQQRLREHLKRTHLGFSKRNKCSFCEERFTDYWRKMDHMVKKHGVPPLVLKCQACERTFDNQRALSRHTRKDHLLEKTHNCTECDMKFFGKSSLQKHMAKHTGLRLFKCDVCLKAYGRKNTLREHMRIHANDRRFSCGKCGQSFVQKCSWRSHMRTKHGECV